MSQTTYTPSTMRMMRLMVGMTRGQLSKTLGFDETQIENLETGAEPITPELDATLLDVLGKPHNPSPEEGEFFVGTPDELIAYRDRQRKRRNV